MSVSETISEIAPIISFCEFNTLYDDKMSEKKRKFNENMSIIENEFNNRICSTKKKFNEETTNDEKKFNEKISNNERELNKEIKNMSNEHNTDMLRIINEELIRCKHEHDELIAQHKDLVKFIISAQKESMKLAHRADEIDKIGDCIEKLELQKKHIEEQM